MKEILSEDRLTDLVALGKAAVRNKVSILRHHVVYNSVRQQGGAPLVLNAGKGGSISHLCDSKCQRPAHLQCAPRHITNMARQGCPGPTLVIRRCEDSREEFAVVHEMPCKHAQGVDKEARLLDSCCKSVTIVLLPREAIWSIAQSVQTF